MLLHDKKSLCETATIERNISNGIIFVEPVLSNLIEIMIKNKRHICVFSGTRLRYRISRVFFFSQAAQ
jgi:hypothetical protein